MLYCALGEKPGNAFIALSETYFLCHFLCHMVPPPPARPLNIKFGLLSIMIISSANSL